MNTGHGPGYQYDHPVGPKGGALGWYVLITVGYAVAWLFGL